MSHETSGEAHRERAETSERRGALPDAAFIGVDGGATSIKAWAVRRESPTGAWLADGPSSVFVHRRLTSFTPKSMFEQLAERHAPALDAAEAHHAELWIAAAARAIAAVAEALGRKRVVVALALPGIKTDDARGVLCSLNGPRIPNFLERLSSELKRLDLELACELPPLIADGFAAAFGERAARDGALARVAQAYYVGSGTGLAEALAIDGRVVALDEVEAHFPKAWALRSEFEASFEELLAASAINRQYAALAHLALPLAKHEFPELKAARRDPLAIGILAQAARALAELIELRARSFAAHGARRLERVVLGQRFADWERAGTEFQSAVRALLAARSNQWKEIEIVVSSLRAAAAIGAIAWLDERSRAP